MECVLFCWHAEPDVDLQSCLVPEYLQAMAHLGGGGGLKWTNLLSFPNSEHNLICKAIRQSRCFTSSRGNNICFTTIGKKKLRISRKIMFLILKTNLNIFSQKYKKPHFRPFSSWTSLGLSPWELKFKKKGLQESKGHFNCCSGLGSNRGRIGSKQTS